MLITRRFWGLGAVDADINESDIRGVTENDWGDVQVGSNSVVKFNAQFAQKSDDAVRLCMCHL
jgi:hypothetical protein